MKKLIILLFAISVVACKTSEKKEEVTEVKKPEVKLYQLVGGSILVKKLEVFSQDTMYTGQQKQFTDAYYVISHPKGNLMWDAGLPEQLVIPQPYDEPSGVYRVQRPDSLANQLKSIGFKVDDITHFAMSHSHFDHTGHANYLKDATLLIQENEYNANLADTLKQKNAAMTALTKVKKLNGDYDVFGDGTVVIKYMPGHTIGHQVLYVEVAGLENPVLLTGDLYHFEENRENRGVPSFNYDVDQTLKSMDKFEAFAKEKNATVIIQHSPKDYMKLANLLAGYSDEKIMNFSGEFTYAADAAAFKDCTSGKTYPVTGQTQFMLLQKAYLKADHESFESEWVSFDGYYRIEKGMSGDLEKHIIVTKFNALEENKKCN